MSIRALCVLATLAVAGDLAGRHYRMDEVPDASDAQRRVREGWLTGATGTR